MCDIKKKIEIFCDNNLHHCMKWWSNDRGMGLLLKK